MKAFSPLSTFEFSREGIIIANIKIKAFFKSHPIAI